MTFLFKFVGLICVILLTSVTIATLTHRPFMSEKLSWLEFVVGMSTSMAWPAAVVMVLWIYRAPITKILERVTSVSVGGVNLSAVLVPGEIAASKVEADESTGDEHPSDANGTPIKNSNSADEVVETEAAPKSASEIATEPLEAKKEEKQSRFITSKNGKRSRFFFKIDDDLAKSINKEFRLSELLRNAPIDIIWDRLIESVEMLNAAVLPKSSQIRIIDKSPNGMQIVFIHMQVRNVIGPEEYTMFVSLCDVMKAIKGGDMPSPNDEKRFINLAVKLIQRLEDIAKEH